MLGTNSLLQRLGALSVASLYFFFWLSQLAAFYENIDLMSYTTLQETVYS